MCANYGKIFIFAVFFFTFFNIITISTIIHKNKYNIFQIKSQEENERKIKKGYRLGTDNPFSILKDDKEISIILYFELIFI